MRFLYCVIYLAALGVLSFIAGRLMAGHRFDYERFPFRPFAFENEGLIYKKIGIHKWQNMLPDMSRIFKKLMPAKKLEGRPDREHMLIMINETCIAELIHALLEIFSLAVLLIWRGWGGFVLWLIYFTGNLPYILMQRYNRPRMIKLSRLCR